MSWTTEKDIWDDEWDTFQTAVVDLAIQWTRMFQNTMNAFAIERVIESIRRGSEMSPPRPWSDLVPTSSIPKNNPFLRVLYTYQPPRQAETKQGVGGVVKSRYILTHPCLMLMNVYHSFLAMIEKHGHDDWAFFKEEISHVMITYADDINAYQESMSFEYRARNKETRRYTELGYTRTYDNSSIRLRRLLKRHKKYYSTSDSFLIRANKRMDLLENPLPLCMFEGAASIQSQAKPIPPSPTLIMDAEEISLQRQGTFGPTQEEVNSVQNIEIKHSHEWNDDNIMF